MSSSNISKGKRISIVVLSILLFYLAVINPTLNFGFTYFSAYLLYALPGLLSLLYLKTAAKNYIVGVYLTSVLSMFISLYLSGGTLNLFNLILYVLLSILVS